RLGRDRRASEWPRGSPSSGSVLYSTHAGSAGRSDRGRTAVGWIALVLLAIPGEPGTTAPAARIAFNRDIRPILSDHCYPCHGPDSARRKAGLRLDLESSAKADHDGVRAIVPGDVDASELYRRSNADDADERMPPPKSGKSLTAS